MKILVFGGTGFIGINLALELSKDKENILTLTGSQPEHFEIIDSLGIPCEKVILDFFAASDFDELTRGQDVVYHLASTNYPAISNHNVADEISVNVNATLKLLDSCVKNKVKRVVFISSGGAVYGEHETFPLREDSEANPISSYGLQKLTIEKLLFLYERVYGLDHRIVRLSNPYGPYQRPNGKLGIIAALIHKAQQDEEVTVFGDGSAVRDYIYIQDAISAILNIAGDDTKYKLYNVGSGKGRSIKELIGQIEDILSVKLRISYEEERKTDIRKNVLDVSRYEAEFGDPVRTSFEDGIKKTAEYLR